MPRNILKQVKSYLLTKKSRTPEENDILNRINEDLEFFSIKRLHRDDLLEYNYDSQLIDNSVMESIASGMGDDYWEQLSSVQIPIICDGKVSGLECPNCSCGMIEFHEGWFVCPECGIKWSSRKFTLTDLALLSKEIISHSHTYPAPQHLGKNKCFVSLEEYRKHFDLDPCKEYLFHIVTNLHEPAKAGFQDERMVVYKPVEEKTVSFFGHDAYWVSCFPDAEDVVFNHMVLRLPIHWQPPLFNNDYSGLDEEEKKELEEFLQTVNDWYPCGIKEETAGFYHSNDAKTKPCDAVEFIFKKLENQDNNEKNIH